METFQSIATCPHHGSQDNKVTHSVTIEKPSVSFQQQSHQTQTSENESHVCSFKIEPTTSCESHFTSGKKIITISSEMTISKKYEADDEKSSADTLNTLRKNPNQIQARNHIEGENSDEIFCPKSTQTPKYRSSTSSRMIDESSSELVAFRSSSKSRKAQATEISRSPSRRRSKSRTYKVVENKFTSFNDGMNPICSASGNISVPHICMRRKHPCNESCTTHVIKEIDEETRVCACVKKHPYLFVKH